MARDGTVRSGPPTGTQTGRLRATERDRALQTSCYQLVIPSLLRFVISTIRSLVRKELALAAGESPCSAGTRRARSRGRATSSSVVPRNVCRSISQAVLRDEQRIVRERRRQVPHLHPPLGPPAHELDLLGARDARCARPPSCRRTRSTSSLTIRPALAEVARHRRARVRRRMLDVRPVHVLARERRGSLRSTRACRRDCRR